MNDFDYDVLQKKRLARNARYTNRVKPGCMLLSDYMTAGQKKKMNGVAITVNLNNPITFAEFKSLSAQTAELYYNNIVTQFNVGERYIAKMMGTSQSTLHHYIIKKGIAAKRVKPGYKDIEKLNKWAQFIGVINGEENEEQELEKHDDVPAGNSASKMQVQTMTIIISNCNKWEDVISAVGSVPIPDNSVITVNVRVME